MGHVYSSQFFDYIDVGVKRSAEVLVETLQVELKAHSVADFGCGRGTWLSQWLTSGANEVLGVDGDYVDRAHLSIPADAFQAHDLTQPLDLGRTFSLAQSLEVAEHLPGEASSTFIDTLVHHSDCVLFSAAVPGQGGEFHINERPLEYWRALFRDRGYAAYDFIRPLLHENAVVEPWYRYNCIVYANAAGAERLSDAILRTRVDDDAPLADFSSSSWKLRKAIVRHLPRSVVTQIAKTRASVIAKRANRDIAAA